jgi:hypothetical protein
LRTVTAPRGTDPARASAARRARVDAICSASLKRTSTWSTTGSTLHPQIESCAEFSITLPQARRRNAAGQASGVTWSAVSGSA